MILTVAGCETGPLPTEEGLLVVSIVVPPMKKTRLVAGAGED
jgi:hypothetical protein